MIKSIKTGWLQDSIHNMNRMKLIFQHLVGSKHQMQIQGNSGNAASNWTPAPTEQEVYSNETLIAYYGNKKTDPSSGTTSRKIPTLWRKSVVRRYANIYEKQLKVRETQSVLEKALYFRYIIKHWDKLQKEGKVRVVPSEARRWFRKKSDAFFKY